MAGYDPYCYWDASRSFDVYGPYVNNYYGHPGRQEDDCDVGLVEKPSLESFSSKGGAGTSGEREDVIIEEFSHVGAPSNEMFPYLAKVINPAKKTDFSLRRFRVNARFKTVRSLKRALQQHFPTCLTGNSTDTQVGYISPGHGVRGRQQWISDDIDIEDMYREYKGKKEITLWFYVNAQSDEGNKKGKKQTHSPGTTESTKRVAYRTAVHTEKMEEVEMILEELKGKHTGTYSEEKLRAWAHLIQMKEHKSYSQPPDMPYFRKGNKGTHAETSDPIQTGVSPCKRLTMRTACIEQMDKWHSLLEKGGITQQQYDQLQEKIMSDMLKL